MKKKIQYVATIALLALIPFSTSVLAQPDRGGGGDLGGGTPPVAGGVPIVDCVYILIAIALAYGSSRWYAMKKVKVLQE